MGQAPPQPPVQQHDRIALAHHRCCWASKPPEQKLRQSAAARWSALPAEPCQVRPSDCVLPAVPALASMLSSAAEAAHSTQAGHTAVSGTDAAGPVRWGVAALVRCQ